MSFWWLFPGWWTKRGHWRLKLNRESGMKWSTRLSEKVPRFNLDVESFRFKCQPPLLLCVPYWLNIVVASGEPHIDGEPGDLRFRIKVLKYDIVTSSLLLWSDAALTTLIWLSAFDFYLFLFPPKTSCVWTARRWPVHQRHHLSRRGTGWIWDGYHSFRRP